jgi:hypothetical protein
MNFADLDWRVLDRLRSTFLQEKFGSIGYWQSHRDLAQYHVTFGERIGWKWDAVLAELREVGWAPDTRMDTLIDWGCGSGVAGQRVLKAFPTLRRAFVADSSPAAVEFALQGLRREHPEAEAKAWSGTDASGCLLVISHVWNELDADQRIQLLQLAGTAAAVLWVEPGTHETARDLQTVRDHFREAFDVLAPCTHQGPCGLLAAGMERHWCHHFASPPPEVFISSDWSRFAVRAGIDLRSVPYSFLCLQRRSAGAAPRSDQGWERLLGRARISKPYARILSCGVCGVCDTEVPKRHLPEWFKTFKNGEEPRRIRWTRDGDRACSAESALSPGLRVNPAD